MVDRFHPDNALVSSENEDLLPGHLAGAWRPSRRSVSAVGFVSALLLVGAVVARGRVASQRQGLMAAPGNTVELDSVAGCFSAGIYWSPANMDGQSRSAELSASRCQARCAATQGCAHFSYWPDGGCNLQGLVASSNQAPAKFSDVISGPALCATRIDSTPPPSASGQPAAACSAYPACKAGGITEGNCCPNSNGVSLACCTPLAPAETTLPPKQGSECSAATECVKAGITEGACCPTTTGIQLTCCPTSAYNGDTPDYNKSQAAQIILGASSHGEALDALKAANFNTMTDDPVFEQCLEHLCTGCEKHPENQNRCHACKYQCPFRTWQCCHRIYCPEAKFSEVEKEPCLSRCGARPAPNC